MNKLSYIYIYISIYLLLTVIFLLKHEIAFQVCITVNNIEHIRQYLNELPRLLDWKTVCDAIEAKHEAPEVGQLAEKTLTKLMTTAQDDLLHKCHALLFMLIHKMSEDLKKHIEIFTRKQPTKRDVSICPFTRNVLDIT